MFIKKMNNIEKVAFIVTMIVVVFITTCTNIPTAIRDRINNALNNERKSIFYVFDEDNIEYTGIDLTMPYSMGKDIEYCQLWPANEMLTGGQYWEYNTDLNQWIGCF